MGRWAGGRRFWGHPASDGTGTAHRELLDPRGYRGQRRNGRGDRLRPQRGANVHGPGRFHRYHRGQRRGIRQRHQPHDRAGTPATGRVDRNGAHPMQSPKTIAVLAGDGIGPEVMAEALKAHPRRRESFRSAIGLPRRGRGRLRHRSARLCAAVGDAGRVRVERRHPLRLGRRAKVGRAAAGTAAGTGRAAAAEKTLRSVLQLAAGAAHPGASSPPAPCGRKSSKTASTFSASES